jgi:hypothetical protein
MVLTATWIAFVGWMAVPAVRADFNPDYSFKMSEYVAMEDLDADRPEMRKARLDPRPPPSEPPSRQYIRSLLIWSWAHLDEDTAEYIAARSQISDAHRALIDSRPKRWPTFAYLALIPPLVLLIVGLGFAWAIKGFQHTPRAGRDKAK